MKNFYLFLDIDGVLFDWVFIKNQIKLGKIKPGGIIKNFNPESINALNILIKELSKKYQVTLVISSTRRLDLGYTINLLYAHGLNDVGEILATPISAEPNKRGREILEFLKDKSKFDFLIIDDEMFDYCEHFSRSKIIKTNMQNDSLNLSHINEYLSNNVKTPLRD